MAGQSKALRIGIIAAAVVGTVAIPATAFAASATDFGTHSMASTSAAIHAQQDNDEDYAGPADGRGGPQAEAHLTTLAAKLNISVDVLKKAMEANRPQHAKRADGVQRHDGSTHLQTLATALGVTPEALKAATQAAREATKPTTKPTTRPDEATRQAHEQAYIAALAAKLNLSVDKVKAAIEQTKPTPPAKPTTAQQKAMIAPRLAEMVKSGKLTQVQADKILADIDAGKPVFEVLKQFMPQLGGGDHRPGQKGPQTGPSQQQRPGQQGQHGPRGSQQGTGA